MNTLIIFTAKYLIALPVVLGLVALWRAGAAERRRAFLIALISFPLSYLLAKIAGHFYYDPRPFVEQGILPLFAHAADNGFPSDHTLLAATIAALVYLLNKRLSIILYPLAVLIGAARVAAAVHHPIDVVGSLIIATIAVALVTYCYDRFQPTKSPDLP